jgi:LysM repeat protein
MTRRFLMIAVALCTVLCSLNAQNSDYVAYIDKYKDIAIEQMKKYRIPASITLAQALLESGAGRSELARNSNNHFGIKCHSWEGGRIYHDDDEAGECFRVYKNVGDSYEDHSVFLSTGARYAFLFEYELTDYVMWARGLKRAGYATNPAYADKLINLIESYGLDRFDRDNAGGTRYAGVHDPMLAHDLVYVVTRAGDTMQGIADEFGISRHKLMRYNDQHKYYVPNKGDIIYLHRKHRRAKKPHKQHVVKEGESMHLISQMYGVRLSRLYKMNDVEPATYAPMSGDVIRLR